MAVLTGDVQFTGTIQPTLHVMKPNFSAHYGLLQTFPRGGRAGLPLNTPGSTQGALEDRAVAWGLGEQLPPPGNGGLHICAGIRFFLSVLSTSTYEVLHSSAESNPRCLSV